MEKMKLDVAAVFSNDEFIAYSFLSQVIGFFADAIVYSEDNRYLGKLRYTWNMLKLFAIHRTIDLEIEYLPPYVNDGEG